MKKLNKNTFGFAHHALLGVLVVAIIAFAGVKVLSSIHAASKPNVGYFSPDTRTAWQNSDKFASLDVSVDTRIKVNKVEWYLNNLNKKSLVATIYKAGKIGNANHFPYQWAISSLPAGSYHWLAEIYTPSDKYLALNNHNQPYLDALVVGKGSVAGKFVNAQNQTVNTNDQAVTPVDVKVRVYGPSDVSKVEWYLGKYLQYTATKATEPYCAGGCGISFFGSCGITAPGDCDDLTYRYNFPDAGIKGPVRWIVKVYDSKGVARLASNNIGGYYLTLWLSENKK